MNFQESSINISLLCIRCAPAAIWPSMSWTPNCLDAVYTCLVVSLNFVYEFQITLFFYIWNMQLTAINLLSIDSQIRVENKMMMRCYNKKAGQPLLTVNCFAKGRNSVFERKMFHSCLECVFLKRKVQTDSTINS